MWTSSVLEYWWSLSILPDRSAFYMPPPSSPSSQGPGLLAQTNSSRSLKQAETLASSFNTCSSDVNRHPLIQMCPAASCTSSLLVVSSGTDEASAH